MIPPGPVSMFGLFVTMTNVSVPLISVNYDVQIKSFASHITIQQTYRNSESATDLECVYGFPINDQAGIVGLTAQIGNRTLNSVFKKKDEAFKEYSDALARNDGAYLLDQSERSDDTFVLSVGRLPPGQECTVSISYVGTLESVTETKLRLTIPTSLYPRYNPTPKAPQTGAVAPENYRTTVPYYATLAGHIAAIATIKSVSSGTHSLNVTNLGPKEAFIRFNSPQQALDRDLQVDIELTNNPVSYVEVEQSSSTGDYTAMYAFVPHFKPEKSYAVNTELIFVVDCSGSMSAESRIEDARSAMQIFLRSIPEGAYFNFFKFGSQFESLFPQSQLYSADTFAQAKAYAAAIQADLGGTEILEPLQKIYSEPPRAGFSRQVFVLTDGEVSNTQEVIALVRSNAATARVFAFGLGQSPSRSLVNDIALAGNGRSEFIKHGVGEPLESSVGRQLNRALQPAITGASVALFGVANVQLVPAVFPPVFRGDRQLVYAIFQRDNTTNISPFIELQIGDAKTKIPFTIPDSVDDKEPAFLVKLAARALIRNLEIDRPADPRPSGSLQVGRAMPAITDGIKSVQQNVTDISLKYGVLSKYVSLVAVEARNGSNATGANPLQLSEIPIQLAAQPTPPSRSYSLFSGHMQAMAMPMPYPHSFNRRAPSSTSMMFGGGSGVGFAMGAPGASFSQSQMLPQENLLSVVDEVDDAGQNADSDSRHAAEWPTTSSLDVSVSRLHSLLNLQHWNGAWTLDNDLARLSNVSVAQVKTAAPTITDDVVLGTILAVAMVKEQFADQQDVWLSIINKATAFLNKQHDQVAVQAAATALRALLDRARA